MNLTTGVFTTPNRGIYHFPFIGLKHWNVEITGVLLRLNENKIIAASYSVSKAAINRLIVEATLKLEIGDRIHVYKNFSGPLLEGEDNYKGSRYTQFTGRLLEEDLDL